MDTKNLKHLEELIELMSDYYNYSNNNPLIAEIRKITSCELDDETIYYDYCNSYSSRCTLLEVRYALMNNGVLEEFALS